MAYATISTLGLIHTWRCSVNGSLSWSCSLSCGVPQGFILGPLLFLLYINDVPNCLSNCQLRIYADDTHLTYAGFSADNIQSCLNDDIVNISNWLIENKLTLNMTKTEFMLIGSRRRMCTLTVPPRPSINDSHIEHVTTARSLGLIIDVKLTWRSHVDKLTKKIASGIRAMKRIRHLVPYGTLHSIYQALVLLQYCLENLWSNFAVQTPKTTKQSSPCLDLF